MASDPSVDELVTAIGRVVYLLWQRGAPDAPAPAPTFYKRQEAAKFVTVSVTTFDRCKSAGWIKPDHTIGVRGHRYAESDLNDLRERLKKESPPNGFKVDPT